MQRRDLTPSPQEDGHQGWGRSLESHPPAFCGGPAAGTQLRGRGEEGRRGKRGGGGAGEWKEGG